MSSGPLQWTPNGLVPTVTSAVGSATRVAAVPSRASEIEGEDDGDGELEAVEGKGIASGVAAPRPAPKQRKRGPAPTEPLSRRNVLALARKRLREVKRDLRRMKALQKEEAELERLIAAAEDKPRAVVRELPKRSAG